MTKQYQYIPILCGLFVASLLTSNLLSSAKIVDLNAEIFGLPLVLDAGTFLFPLCYVIGDLLTEVYGYRQARKIIWIGFFSSLILVSSVYFVGLLPAEEYWQNEVGEVAYQKILGSIAGGGIIIASLLAYLFGELSNSILLSKLKILTRGKFLWMRTIGSSLVGQTLDSAIFVTVAVLLGVFPWEIWLSLFLTSTVFKILIEILLTPLTYLAVWTLKKLEGVDFYDEKTSYSFF